MVILLYYDAIIEMNYVTYYGVFYKITKTGEVDLLYRRFRVDRHRVGHCAVMDALNLNLNFNDEHCTRITILSGEGVSASIILKSIIVYVFNYKIICKCP